MGNTGWYPGAGSTWEASWKNKGTGPGPIFGTDLTSWPALDDYGDATTAQDITVNPNTNPVIQGTDTIPAACLPYGDNATDPEGFYYIENIHHRGNLIVACPSVKLNGDHTLPDSTIVSKTSISEFSSSGTIWVGTTKITYTSKNVDDRTFEGCSGVNLYKPFELDDAIIVQPVKLKLRYYKLSNRTPDKLVWANNDPNTGCIDNATDQGAIFDIQHFYSLCAGNSPSAIQMGAGHESYIRNFFIECCLQDASKGGQYQTANRWAHGTVENHPEAGTGGRHADGFQWEHFDNTSLTRSGLPTLQEIFFLGNCNNSHVFTNPGGSSKPDAYATGLWADSCLFGGFTTIDPAGKAFHSGSSNGTLFSDCWIRDDYYNFPNPFGQELNLTYLRVKFADGGQSTKSIDSYQGLTNIF